MRTPKILILFRYTLSLLLIVLLFSCEKEDITAVNESTPILNPLNALNAPSDIEDRQKLAPNFPKDNYNTKGTSAWLTAHRGPTSNHVFINRSSSGTVFQEWQSLNRNEETKQTPTLVRGGGRIFSYYRGLSDRLFFAWSDDQGSTWQGNWGIGLSDDEIGAGPSAVFYNGEIYIFSTSNDANRATIKYYKTTNGFSYQGPFTPNLVYTRAEKKLEVAPVVVGGLLYLFYTTYDDRIEGMLTVDGTENTWTRSFSGSDANESTKAGISATYISTTNQIALAFTGQSSKRVLVKKAGVSTSTGALTWSNDVHTGAYSEKKPGIATDGSTLSVVYRDGTKSGAEYITGDYSSVNSNSWSPMPFSSQPSNPGYMGLTDEGVSLLYTGF